MEYAVSALNALSGRIGIARAAGRNGRTDEYGIFQVRGNGTLDVRYEGYTEAGIMHGTRPRDQHVLFNTSADGLDVTIFGQEDAR
jgi:hypothetical protein